MTGTEGAGPAALRPGPMTETEFRSALQTAGFGEIEISETHRVHEHAGSAIIRARKLWP